MRCTAQAGSATPTRAAHVYLICGHNYVLCDRMRAWKSAWMSPQCEHGADILLCEKFYLNSQNSMGIHVLMAKANRKQINYTECRQKAQPLEIRTAHAMTLTYHTGRIKCIAASHDIMNILTNLSKTTNHIFTFHRVIGHCVENNYHTTSHDETTYCGKVSRVNCMKTLIWIVIFPSAGMYLFFVY